MVMFESISKHARFSLASVAERSGMTMERPKLSGKVGKLSKPQLTMRPFPAIKLRLQTISVSGLAKPLQENSTSRSLTTESTKAR